ncbi:hypothetical protein BST97_01550 [Nonlabens spongiae]|uniref:RNA polymerase subunit sigma-70 n=1 Tax=Nonlabens spongiae TaxID=331648 RepID=A0A1W6MGT7_9FLAO|nr:sigma-70 family RNA polymerase sigma factor [Nonlabens spongiae]ARN76790.1 hypothetical protein BST97_01550 [Nonlabens spongiae]
MSHKNKVDSELKRRFQENDPEALRDVYVAYKDELLNWLIRYNLNMEDRLDIYQDAIIELQHKLVTQKVTLEKASIKTYLFGICKFLAIRHHKARKMEQVSDSEEQVAEIKVEEDLSENSKLLALSFKKLGAACQELISMFYYRGLTIKEMVELSNYKDENTVKSAKSRCMKKLKELVSYEK